ncbi:LlaJI family restriction endonuclease [Clostridium sp. KNHs214]|uniref:LlaJI family restriction endonuclease n=1 Tax=Clostridium sp. KNHs214 TaxID=1540257 RepID=UPI00054E2690|nr:LlaJI family restriction endonuclease [Clostridium sp. KNHs214]
MKSAYFIELEKLSLSQISNRLDISVDETKELISKLKYKNRRIIKSHSELKEINDTDEIDEDLEKFAFKYVGIILYKNIVIKCLPKYLSRTYTTEEKDRLLKLIIQVLRKYGIVESNVGTIDVYESEEAIDMLNLIIYILTDFIDNGLYHNQKNVYEINGDGEIDWDKTVNEIDPFVIKNRPIYFDLITYENIDNNNDFFRMLHKYVITQSSRMLSEVGLNNIFSLPEIEFEVDENWFLDERYVINRINQELNIQFVAKKQTLLKVMLAFFERKFNKDIDDRYQLFGTMDFNLVWEKVCAIVLDNKCNTRLNAISELDQTIVQAKYVKATGEVKRLKELVPFPYWIPNEDLTTIPSQKRHKAKKSLVLDLISIFRNNTDKYFVIWDAKYYNLHLEVDTVNGNPGVEDVIKQYVYEAIYKQFMIEHGFNKKYNILLFPSDKDVTEEKGIAELKEIKDMLAVGNILVKKVPAHMMFELYIKNKQLNAYEYFNL